MAIDEEMFALLKSNNWQACHRRIDAEGRGDTREQRVSIALWRAAILEREKRYDEALRTLDAIRDEAFTRNGFLWERADVLCRMGKFEEALDTLRSAPFGAELDAFPALTYEAIFLYCYLLKRSNREPPPNLLAALPGDFRTMLYDGRFVSKADIAPPAGRPPADD
jgi:tetratricopeptide (TPR) repeat protein